MALDPNILNSLSKQVPRIARPQIEKRFRAAFQKVKNEMIAEFLNHPVTIEIKGGIGAKNLSGTLDGITNLFSFIGFDSSSDPTSQIENMLYKTNFKFDRYLIQIYYYLCPPSGSNPSQKSPFLSLSPNFFQ